MSRALSMVAAVLLCALMLALASGAQGPARGELFTFVEIDGWDFSSYDEKIREAVTKANAKGAGESERRAAAAAFAERANFFRDAGRPTFYKYAVGDYRHALRFDPDDRDSKGKLDEILGIYVSMGRPAPQNGNAKSGGAFLVELYRTTPKRIAFEPGKTYADSGYVTERAAFLYELDALAGQRLSAGVRPAAAKASGADGEDEKSEAVFDLYLEDARGRTRLVNGAEKDDYTLPTEGKYLIRVYSKAGQSDYYLQASLN